MSRLLKPTVLLAALILGGCGFHLRQSASLPPSMHRMHLDVSGGGSLQRDLTRSLVASGVDVEEKGGPGIAELHVPQALFSTNMLTVSGLSRVTEYTVSYHVNFDVVGADGTLLLAPQNIQMSRNYSYDATNTVGNSAQVEQIQQSLNDDMVQAMLFRLQAAARRGDPASTGKP